MTTSRRRFMHIPAASISALLARVANAQDYPNRSVRIIVGATPGSAPDVIARLIAQWLSERLGQPFVIENRAGAGGNLAAEPVMRAAPDGYLLLVFTSSYAIDVTLLDTLNFNLQRDIAPVAGLTELPMLLLVNTSFPAKTFPEFIDYAKANPGKINIGTPPVGSPQYVSGALLEMMTGTKLALIPYRGGPPAVTDALSGQIQGVIGTVLLLIDQVRSGALRPLAITSATRSALLPDVPSVAEFLPGYDASQWIGIGAPKATPESIVRRLNAEINGAFIDPIIRARIAALGGMPLAGSPEAFGKFVADETVKWARVVKFSGAKAN